MFLHFFLSIGKQWRKFSSANTITQAQGPGGKTLNSALRKTSIIVAKTYPVATY